MEGDSKSGSWILLTNDDGPDSPALVPLLQELSRLAQVRAVVPESECSWTAKIMSRFNTLEVKQRRLGEYCLWTLNGYPADCANLGIHTLFDTPPALVISGINMGTNAGLAYLLSSGTVGAAVEGMLSGLPAAAFSVELEPQDYRCWRQQRILSPAVEKLLANAAKVTGEIVTELLQNGLPEGASLLNVNMPSRTTLDTPRRLTRVTLTGYGSYFAPIDGRQRFRYSFSGLHLLEENPEGDIAALARGEVAIAPIRFALSATPSTEDRRRFERHAGDRPWE